MWGVVTRLWARQSGFNSLQVRKTFLFYKTYRPTLGRTQPNIQCVSGVISLAEKWSGHKRDDHSPLTFAEVKNKWSHTVTPRMCHHRTHNEALPLP